MSEIWDEPSAGLDTIHRALKLLNEERDAWKAKFEEIQKKVEKLNAEVVDWEKKAALNAEACKAMTALAASKIKELEEERQSNPGTVYYQVRNRDSFLPYWTKDPEPGCTVLKKARFD